MASKEGDDEMSNPGEKTEKDLYTLGLDFGTLSGRAILVDIGNGSVVSEAVMDYPHAVMDSVLPCGTPIPRGWAFQHPGDYLEVLDYVVPEAVKNSGIDPAKIIGMAVDFTGCTLVTLDKEGTPLCFLPEFEAEPLSWVIHWKHHGAAPYRGEVQAALEACDPGMLRRHGGTLSDEGMMVKILQVVREAPDVYDAADLIMEAGDWVTMKLTGDLVRSQAMAGFKAFWQEEKGYPDNDFYCRIDPRLKDYATTKLRGELRMIGERAGGLCPEMAEKFGLLPGTPVAVAHYDGHAALLGAGISEPGVVMLTLGTSGGFILAHEEAHAVQGTTGMTENGDLPGFYGYASGQSAVGDGFAWFVKNMLPERLLLEAEDRGITVQELLSERAAGLKPGESGLLALDWLSGNRSVLADSNLSCVMLGMTLQTKPEEIYRALLESVAFGTRRIRDSYERAGIAVKGIHAVGGIVKKNPLLMQIYADVLNCHISICKSTQAAALGAAMFAAAAAGEEKGSYSTITEAIDRMSELEPYGYDPITENAAVYQKLYEEFEQLHDYFGCGGNDVMKRLRDIQRTG
ncbi:MAG: ribulokinase [Lachnospiraceae bacterium]|nr:ribulokinase [Lachnospiraceae bacterium]